MKDLIIVAVLLCILIGALVYIYKAKKRGEKCVGCPYSKQCGGKCNNGSANSKTQSK